MANNKNEVFEYLIDQLRQQIPVVDVMGEIKRWSIDRSIAGRGNYTDDENAIIDAYIGLEHNPHKRRRNALHPEIQARRKAVRACGFQNGKAVNLGEFKTKERAAIANRLFNYWKSLGYDDIPTKPQRRQYIWRHK